MPVRSSSIAASSCGASGAGAAKSYGWQLSSLPEEKLLPPAGLLVVAQLGDLQARPSEPNADSTALEDRDARPTHAVLDPVVVRRALLAVGGDVRDRSLDRLAL